MGVSWRSDVGFGYLECSIPSFEAVYNCKEAPSGGYYLGVKIEDSRTSSRIDLNLRFEFAMVCIHGLRHTTSNHIVRIYRYSPIPSFYT